MFPRWFNLVMTLVALVCIPITIYMGRPLHTMVWGTVAILEVFIYYVKGE